MKNITFVCNWNKNREKSWSGTHLSLYRALSQYYDLIDIDLHVENKNIIYRFLKKIGLMKDDLGIGILKKKNKTFVSNPQYPILQFFDCPYDFNNMQFIYQDLYYGYLVNLFNQNPYIFKISGFQNCDIKKLKKRAFCQKKYFLSNNCAGIFTMGKWLANELVQNYGIPSVKVHHVGGGYNIDPSFIDYNMKENKRFLFVGRDFNRKNGQLVVDAFKILHNLNSSFELYIIGPDNLSLNEDGIFCLGNLSNVEKIRYFNMCDVFVLPSIFEAYGLVFPEALIYGLPCIGRDAYEMPYFIEDGITGYLLHSNSPIELSELMLKAITNTTLRDNVIKNREYYLKEYSWDTVAKRITNIIENVTTRYY